MLIPSRAYFFLYTRCRPAGRAGEEGNRSSHLSRGRVDAHRTAIVHTLTVDVPFDQISLFELQRRRVMTRQGTLVKRTRKKRNLANEGPGVRSNLRTYVSYAPGYSVLSTLTFY